MSNSNIFPSEAADRWPHPPWIWPARLEGRLAAGFARQQTRQAVHAPGHAGLVGWKIGGNDPGTRMRWGIDNCLFGYLTNATCHSGDHAFSISNTKCAAVEPEIWIEVLRDLWGNEPAHDVGSAIGRIGLAAEIVAVQGRFDDVAAVLESNIFHREATFPEPCRSVGAGDIKTILLVVSTNSRERWRLPVTTLIPDLREIVAFIAAALTSRGDRLRAGQRVLSGVLTPLPVWVQPGDQVVVTAGDLGALRLTFDRSETE